MKIKLKEFEEVLLDEERSSNTIDAYTRSVRIFFERYEKVSKQNMLAFKKWQMEKWKPKTAWICGCSVISIDTEITEGTIKGKKE